MEKIWFDSWDSILRTSIVTICAYLSMICILRVSGKRTLSKMNAFDFIVTIASGSILAAISLNKKIVLADGLLALSLLIFLQYALTWLSVRIMAVKKIITSQPAMIFYKGEEIPGALKKERVTKQDLYLAARNKGITNLSQIEVVVLETTGELTIMTSDSAEENSQTLSDVHMAK